MADIRTPYSDMVGTRPSGEHAPNLGDNPVGKATGVSIPGGEVTPKELPFNSLKIGTPDKANSPYPK